jgi:hypothetical protein
MELTSYEKGYANGNNANIPQAPKVRGIECLTSITVLSD